MQSPLETLKKYWNYPAFRPGQEEIIQSVLAGRDTLALLPTGGGKSICYQVPGLMSGGLTLVISPLIALMRDQVENLNKRGIPATFINSTLSFAQIDRKLSLAMEGSYRFLYIAPERVKTEMFQARVQQMNVKLIAVDEAHCISQWGYDFRPAYQNLPVLREWLPGIPVLAVTATATPEVKTDILEKLEMKDPRVFAQSFRRDNLSFRVYQTDNAAGKILELVRKFAGSGIIYCRTRRRTAYLAKILSENGIPSQAYHGGMDNKDRTEVQARWISNEIRVIAATNAFGMGIDKPDVRFVLHYNLPSELESYYQEAGRAGRDGKPGVAAVISNPSDQAELSDWALEKYPPFETVADSYDRLCDIFRIPNVGAVEAIHGFDVGQAATKAGIPARTFYHALRILDNEGVLNFEENPDNFALIRFRIGPRAVLEFKERHPAYAKLVDFILRNSGGEVYIQEISFLPASWAGRLKIRQEELEEQLRFMGERGWIDYQPARALPQIRFFQPRHRLTRNELNWHKYNFLQDLGKTRLEKMLEYVGPAGGCRSRFIQQYFGEKTTENCGKCDLCQAVGRPALTRDAIHARILVELEQGPVTYREMLKRIEGEAGDALEACLRELIDRRVIRVDAQTFLFPGENI